MTSGSQAFRLKQGRKSITFATKENLLKAAFCVHQNKSKGHYTTRIYPLPNRTLMVKTVSEDVHADPNLRSEFAAAVVGRIHRHQDCTDYVVAVLAAVPPIVVVANVFVLEILDGIAVAVAAGDDDDDDGVGLELYQPLQLLGTEREQIPLLVLPQTMPTKNCPHRHCSY